MTWEKGNGRRTVDDVLIRRTTLLSDADELVDLVLHAALQHLHLLEHDTRLDGSVDAVSGAVPAGWTVLRAERGLRRGAFGQRMANRATSGDEAEGL